MSAGIESSPADATAHRLVLLHERGGSPQELLWPELVDSLETMGTNAPAVLLVDGGDHSYYHDREDFDWGTHILEEAIPAARERLDTDPRKEAIGGFSMGGFGALDLGPPAPVLRRRRALPGSLGRRRADAGGEPSPTTPRTSSATTCSSSRRSGRACSAGRKSGSTWVATTAFRDNTVRLGALVDAPAKTPPGEHSTAFWRSMSTNTSGSTTRP